VSEMPFSARDDIGLSSPKTSGTMSLCESRSALASPGKLRVCKWTPCRTELGFHSCVRARYVPSLVVVQYYQTCTQPNSHIYELCGYMARGADVSV